MFLKKKIKIFIFENCRSKLKARAVRFSLILRFSSFRIFSFGDIKVLNSPLISGVKRLNELKVSKLIIYSGIFHSYAVLKKAPGYIALIIFIPLNFPFANLGNRWSNMWSLTLYDFGTASFVYSSMKWASVLNTSIISIHGKCK